jgi:hypothetical protein
MVESASRPSAPQPLVGVRVIDIASFLAGPIGAMFLADFGADVVNRTPRHRRRVALLGQQQERCRPLLQGSQSQQALRHRRSAHAARRRDRHASGQDGRYTRRDDGVSAAANETGAAADQVLSAASNLSKQAERLSGEVTTFLAGVRAA